MFSGIAPPYFGIEMALVPFLLCTKQLQYYYSKKMAVLLLSRIMADFFFNIVGTNYYFLLFFIDCFISKNKYDQLSKIQKEEEAVSRKYVVFSLDIIPKLYHLII